MLSIVVNVVGHSNSGRTAQELVRSRPSPVQDQVEALGALSAIFIAAAAAVVVVAMSQLGLGLALAMVMVLYAVCSDRCRDLLLLPWLCLWL